MHQQACRPPLYKDGSFAIGNGEGGGIMTSIAHYYISLLSGMRNTDDRHHLVGQLTSEASFIFRFTSFRSLGPNF